MESNMRRQHVLIVDDEPDVLDFVGYVLREAGFATTEVGDGQAALMKLTGGQEFDLLLTDINMPGIDGFELARRARQLRPELRVLHASGGYFPGMLPDLVREDFLPKPFRPRDLLNCVFEILNRGSPQ
jgi:two-component system cell cycle sensor histidine kinase/response regulator CckA